MSYKLFLDDVRVPADCLSYNYNTIYKSSDWVIVKDYDEFCNCITERGLPHTISFDHDLADEHYRPPMYSRDGHYTNYYTDGTFKEKTGYDCAKWFINWCITNQIHIDTKIYIHSMNPVGSLNIKSLFDTYHKIYTQN